MDQWGLGFLSHSENESFSSPTKDSESSLQHHSASGPPPQLTSTPISISAARFIRKRRARMLGLSASSSSISASSTKLPPLSQRPVRLRRTVIQNKQNNNSSASSSGDSEKGGNSNGKKKTKTVKVQPPPLTPVQMEIRRLYETILRTHRKTLRENINKAWLDNWKNYESLMKQHHRFQTVKVTSSILHSRCVVSSEDIIQATADAAVNTATTADRIKVTVMSEGSTRFGDSGSTKQDQRIPVTTIGHVSQIPPVLDWTAIPHNMHEDDGKFLTNIPFLGDEFIDKDSNFIDEMVTLYEGKVHEDKDTSSFRKMHDEVLCTLVQSMVRIEADVPGVFDEDNGEKKQVKAETKSSFEENKVEIEESNRRKESPKKTSFSDVAAKLFSSAAAGGGEASPSKSEVGQQESMSGEAAVFAMPDLIPEVTVPKEEVVGDSKEEEGEEKDKLTEPPVISCEVEKMEVVEENENVIERQNLYGEPSSSSVVGDETNIENLCLIETSTKPSDAIFKILSSTFKGLGSPSEIRVKYENAERSRNAPQLSILPNGMEQQKPESYSIPNIEGPFAKYLPKEATMHAYQFLFCRRCFIYDCKRHTGDDQVDAKHYKRNRQVPSSSSSSTSSASFTNAFNFVCENPDCWKKISVGVRNADEVLTEWTPSDRSLFLCFIDSFPSNYCFIAKLMRNKTCAQVKEYADLENVPTFVESCPRGITPRTKSKHRKKSSANSNSKKNVTRRWINKVKKTEEIREEGGIKSAGILPIRYMPCLHENGEECDASCTCRINKTSCEKFCTCALTCPYRFPGCKCLSTCDSKRCICFAAARECDPDLCFGCGANELDLEKISCHNVNIQRKLHKHLLMGRSDISGWGIYIMNDAQKGEFIAEYRGELISYDESERRGHVYDKIQHTFLFELNDHFVVDATRKGNKARFVNSSKNPNCEVKRMLVNGDHRIGIYAKRFIEAGEELFYDYEDVLEKQQKAAEGLNRKRKE